MTVDLLALWYSRKVYITPSNNLLLFLHLTMQLVLAPSASDAPSGAWDSIHVFEAAERGRTAHYRLTSTIMLHLRTKTQTRVSDIDEAKNLGKEEAGEITLRGSMTRQVGPHSTLYAFLPFTTLVYSPSMIPNLQFKHCSLSSETHLISMLLLLSLIFI